MQILLRWLVAVTALVTTAVITLPNGARACSCNGAALVTSSPMADARDVPLDLAPVIYGSFEESAVSWVERAGGGAIPFTIRSGKANGGLCRGRMAELIPRAPLSPNSTYEVRVGPNVDDAFRFTTGTRTIPASPLAAPDAAISVRISEGPAATCGGRASISLSGADSQNETEVIVLDADDKELAWTFLRREGGVLLDEVPRCVELRTRDAAGRRSPALRLCDSQLAERDAGRDDGGELAGDSGPGGASHGADASLGPDASLNVDASLIADQDSQAPAPSKRGSSCSLVSFADGASFWAVLSLASLALRRRRS